ncbi:MAG: hypothetical protein K8I65_13180 [Thermoanaerobaculia bacterium]|nr:hypothetical protein [Thermoanaerobaculia bacterium]
MGKVGKGSLSAPERERFLIVVEARDPATALPGLRRLLKRLGRVYRLRALSVERADPVPQNENYGAFSGDRAEGEIFTRAENIRPHQED